MLITGRKKGSKATLALFEEMAEGRDDVVVIAADMSHTEHMCFDECTMGRESRIFLNRRLLR